MIKLGATEITLPGIDSGYVGTNLVYSSYAYDTITGVSPLFLTNSLNKSLRFLTQYGKCIQDGTPTPDAPVDIACNNGAIKFGWHDIITTSQLSGYGTYVSPVSSAGTRAYKWLENIPNGTYQFTIEGDYELIVQWRDPADTSVIIPSAYENLSSWMTSGVVTLDKTTGGYGIAVRRTSGTDSIMPSNFDGTLHVQEHGIYTDDTPEVLMVSGKNLANVNADTAKVGWYISAQGQETESPQNWFYNAYIRVKPNTKYTLSMSPSVYFVSISEYSTAENSGFIVRKTGSTGSNTSLAITTGANTNYVRFGTNVRQADITLSDILVINWQLEEGDTATAYEPYVTPQTVTDIPMLLSVGDVKDEGKIVSGGQAHKVGVYVFTGDETFGTSTAYGKCILWNKQNHRLGANSDVAPLCTHYSGLVSPSGIQAENTCFFNATGHFYFRVLDNDTTTFKADLAAKYASGNPVIMLYALAEETTEQTTPHSLYSYEGSTIIDAVSAVNPVTLSAEYAKKGG